MVSRAAPVENSCTYKFPLSILILLLLFFLFIYIKRINQKTPLINEIYQPIVNLPRSVGAATPFPFADHYANYATWDTGNILWKVDEEPQFVFHKISLDILFVCKVNLD